MRPAVTALPSVIPSGRKGRNDMSAHESKSFIADLHVHSLYSHDCDAALADICTAAVEKQIDLICITDHCDLYPNHQPQEILERREQAFRGIAQAGEQDTRVEILNGVELGGSFIMPDLAQRVIDDLPYDMIIGSVHGIMFRGERRSTSKFDFGSVDEETMLAYLDGYMDAAVCMAENMDVDVLAHLTYIFRYINGKYGKNLDWHIQQKKLERVLSAMIQRKIALEINTSCVGSTYDVWLPNQEILEMYIQMGGRLFTLGSDAHKPEKIGTGFADVKAFLRQKGIDSLVYYKQRKPRFYGI